MGYYVSNLIGIRTGGVFSGETDIEDVKKRVTNIIHEMKNDENWNDINISEDSLPNVISNELVASKGSYIVIGGVFNYWTWDRSSEFSKRLSKEFGTEVLHACWDEQKGEKNFDVFLDGKLIDEVNENPIWSIIRRVG